MTWQKTKINGKTFDEFWRQSFKIAGHSRTNILYSMKNGISEFEQYITALLKAHDQKLIKQIEKIKKEVQGRQGTYKYDWCFEDIIKLLK
jgi:hypothetical protein